MASIIMKAPVSHATTIARLVRTSTAAATPRFAQIARKGRIRTKLDLHRVRIAQMAKLLIPRDPPLRMIAQPQAEERFHRKNFRE